MISENQKTILYIDDDQENLDVFFFAFRDIYKIHITKSIQEAWRLLNTEEIHVLISDHRMPDMLGLDFIYQVHSTYPNIVSILLTAFSDSEVMLDAINRVGVYRYVLKPWLEHEMLMTLQNAFEKHELFIEKQKLLNDLKDQNEQLKIEKEKAEESARLKAAFLGNISHEIRTPMNGIIGFSELMLDDKLNNELKKKYSLLVNTSCKNLLAVLDDIILMSQLQAETYSTNENKCLLGDIKDYVLDLSNKLTEKYSSVQVEFSIDSKESNSEMVCHFYTLQVILSKIIDNAFKYTQQGSIVVGLDKDLNEGDNWLIMKVSDTGIGIAKEHHEKIFDPFYQPHTEKGTLNAGNGVGLSIVKSLVDLLGGSISINSEPGTGTTVIVWVPIRSSGE